MSSRGTTMIRILEPHQGHWLILDEFSRAEIDKAIGGLYTALGGGDQQIRLWFEDVPQRQIVWLPKRFRLIGTMNSVDTAYVFSFSQGLTRRFQFIYVGVPDKPQLTTEIKSAALQAGLGMPLRMAGLIRTTTRR